MSQTSERQPTNFELPTLSDRVPQLTDPEPLPTPSTNTPSASPGRRRSSASALAILIRLGLPVVFLVAGAAAFIKLSKPVEKDQKEPEPPKSLRTQIVELEVGDYPVVIPTNGKVAPHNQVTLSSEVTGQVKTISPSFEVGAYFNAGDVLMRLDDRDYQTAVAVADAQLQSAQAALEE